MEVNFSSVKSPVKSIFFCGVVCITTETCESISIILFGWHIEGTGFITLHYIPPQSGV